MDMKDWLIVIATIVIAISTVVYTIYARKQWKIMASTIEHFHLDQRAWIGVNQISGIKYADSGKQVYIKEGQQFIPEISFTNSGKTPAINVKTAIRMGWLKAGVQPDFPLTDAESVLNSTTYVVNPNVVSYFSPALFDKLPTKSDIDKLTSGQDYICVIGMITYEDIFHRSHFTKFCMKLDPDLTRISPCSIYNEAN